jgi:hypothetical protein
LSEDLSVERGRPYIFQADARKSCGLFSVAR